MAVSSSNIVTTAYKHAMSELAAIDIDDSIKHHIATNYAHAYFDYVYCNNPIAKSFFTIAKTPNPFNLLIYDQLFG